MSNTTTLPVFIGSYAVTLFSIILHFDRLDLSQHNKLFCTAGEYVAHLFAGPHDPNLFA